MYAHKRSSLTEATDEHTRKYPHAHTRAHTHKCELINYHQTRDAIVMGIREYPFDGERICVQSYCVSFFLPQRARARA